MVKKDEQIKTAVEVVPETVAPIPAPIPTDKKKASWEYSTVTKIAKVTFPDGKSKTFDLTEKVRGLSITQECLVFYGFKQWVASNAASLKTTTEKIDSFTKDYDDMMKTGLTMAGSGQLSVIGRERANATPKTQDALILPGMSTYTLEQLKSIIGSLSLNLFKVSDEMLTKINERIAELSK